MSHLVVVWLIVGFTCNGQNLAYTSYAWNTLVLMTKDMDIKVLALLIVLIIKNVILKYYLDHTPTL